MEKNKVTTSEKSTFKMYAPSSVLLGQTVDSQGWKVSVNEQQRL